MDRFIEFKDTVSLEELEQSLIANESPIFLLRFSKLTGTVKIRVEDGLNKKEIKRAFLPHRVKKIHTDFPLEKMPGANLKTLS